MGKKRPQLHVASRRRDPGKKKKKKKGEKKRKRQGSSNIAQVDTRRIHLLYTAAHTYIPCSQELRYNGFSPLPLSTQPGPRPSVSREKLGPADRPTRGGLFFLFLCVYQLQSLRWLLVSFHVKTGLNSSREGGSPKKPGSLGIRVGVQLMRDARIAIPLETGDSRRPCADWLPSPRLAPRTAS